MTLTIDRNDHRTPSVTMLGFGRFARRLALALLKAGVRAGHLVLALPGAVMRAFAMAYVDPFSPPRHTDDWSHPDRY